MELDWSQILPSLFSGALGGGFVSAIIADKLTRNRVLKEQKMQLLKDLMATKFSNYLDQKGAEAVNYVPVLFADARNVITVWERFHDAVINNTNNKTDAFNELVVRIAENVGIKIHSAKLLKTSIISYKWEWEEGELKKRMHMEAA